MNKYVEKIKKIIKQFNENISMQLKYLKKIFENTLKLSFCFY